MKPHNVYNVRLEDRVKCNDVEIFTFYDLIIRYYIYL